MHYEIHEEEVRSRLYGREKLEYRFAYVDGRDASFLTRLMRLVLHLVHHEDMADELSYILLELVTNANKANIKRIYFMEHKRDIRNPEEYREMMADFSRVIQNDNSPYIPKFETYRLYTVVSFHIEEDRLLICVTNSQRATSQELDRIQRVIRTARVLRTVIEAFDRISDRTEGANLGTISTLLMLRKLGLGDDAYRFDSDEQKNETTVTLDIPLDTVTDKQAGKLSETIIREIDTLPAFPENITKLQRMISDENVDFGSVADVFQTDPALTADLLKVVNSAQYMIPKRVSNITNALSLIGIKGIKNLLYAFGTQQIMNRNFGKYEALWEDAYRTASYAFNLARELRMNALRDDAYIGGILHDMGKIMIFHAHRGLLESLNAHSRAIGADENTLERLALGDSHARIGAEISKRWNFPDVFTAVIRFHHTPLLAPDEFQDIVALVYLAVMMGEPDQAEPLFHRIEKEVLERFGILNEAKLLDLKQKVESLYHEQKTKVP
jgi:HD-like signal output (HDOD) protein